MSKTPRSIGTLIAVILKARNLPNKRHIGKQDPYCLVTLNGEKRRTKAIRRGGQHPEWDEEIRFNLYEDDEVESAVTSLDGTPPPPPPKKDDKSPPKIKGGRSMLIACYAEDLREPDFIGEAKVDLTEVLTKGETDEWFTLMNKDKYSGEVYLELTFWSSEPAPVKKTTPKPKTKKSYGGPGTFVPASESSTSLHSTQYDGLSVSSRLSSNASISSEVSRRDAIPSSLRASNSLAKMDLYVPPYETSRSHQQIPSVGSMTSEFAELNVQGTGHRRTSFPPSRNSYIPQPSSSYDFSESYGHSSNASYSHEQGSYSDGNPSSVYERSVTPTAPYQSTLPTPTTSHYQSSYDNNNPPYQAPVRRSRYSIPPASSGFMPVPSPAPSSFASISSHLSQPSGFAPPRSTTPTPLGYGPPPGMPLMPVASTPAPLAFGAPPLSHTPMPTSSFPSHIAQQPSTIVAPNQPSTFQPPTTPYASYQQYGSSGNLNSQQYAPPPPPQTHQHPPPAPPSPNPQMQQQLVHVPPPPPLVPSHSHSLPTPPDLNGALVVASPTGIPPPPPLHENSQHAHGRPLPQPSPSHSLTHPQPRRQSSLPVPPGPSSGAYSPTGTPTHSISPSQSYGNIPPPPPAPSSQILQSMQHPAAPIPQTVPQPPPLPFPRVPSSSFPAANPGQSQPPQGLVAPPTNHTRRPSLPPPPVVYQHQQPQPSAFSSIPPPPPPPSMSYQGQELSVGFPSAMSGQAIYPGPLPRPPSQYFPSHQVTHSYSAPSPIVDGGWQ
ncbi:hypothetical protein C8Q75DRAFT_880942 [Abortiporus biennis]|nr:hypothetical protein C8Q75DRAFT_880942 [Abortiporus biennis]